MRVWSDIRGVMSKHAALTQENSSCNPQSVPEPSWSPRDWTLGGKQPSLPTGVHQIFFPELTSSLQMNHTKKREAFLEPHGEAFLLWPFPSAEFSSICLLAFGVFLFGSYGVDATMKPAVGVGGTPVMHTITQSASSKAFVFLLGH